MVDMKEQTIGLPRHGYFNIYGVVLHSLSKHILDTGMLSSSFSCTCRPFFLHTCGCEKEKANGNMFFRLSQ